MTTNVRINDLMKDIRSFLDVCNRYTAKVPTFHSYTIVSFSKSSDAHFFDDAFNNNKTCMYVNIRCCQYNTLHRMHKKNKIIHLKQFVCLCFSISLIIRNCKRSDIMYNYQNKIVYTRKSKRKKSFLTSYVYIYIYIYIARM
jgi:hypothetical protein